ncbi:MAG: cation-translocating P-type ATPase [Bacteroidota bacterium]|nr:cation-translocating P-type ATPase [Bacteroidota bacterium]
MSVEPVKIDFIVEGMSCSSCSLGIKRQLEKMGMSSVSVEYTTKEVSFETEDKSKIPLAIKKIEDLGYFVVSADKEKEVKEKGLSDIEKKFYFSFIFTIPLLIAMFLPFPLFHNPLFQLVLTIPVFVVGLFHFGKSAYGSIKTGILNMDVLIILGATAAFVYSLAGTILGLGHNFLFYETTASIITLVLLGNLLEHIAVKKNTSAIDDMAKLQKVIARKVFIECDGKEVVKDIDSNRIRLNDILLINLGDYVPVDGEIIRGNASIDEAMLSGESIPVDKNVGDKVVGGTIVVDGSIRIRVTAIGKQTILSQIIELVKSAQKDKPRLQNLADKISAIFVPTVIAISIITFIIAFFVLSIPFRQSLLQSIAVLVISCPCAMGLAIPTAVVVGISRVARNGILIKGASTIQKLTEIKTIAFDKTGTLTTGNFKIRKIECFDKQENEVKKILYNFEKHSSHPISRSLVNEIDIHEEIPVDKVQEIKGGGIIGSDIYGNQYRIGSYEYANKLTSDNSHNIYVVENEKLIAQIDIEDEIRGEAKAVIDFLIAKDIHPVMISGDRKNKCDYVAQKLGIVDYYYEKKPAEKLTLINNFAQHNGIIMVGDGINDAPALATATLGISMSNASQIAIKSAQIILLKGNLNLLRKAIAISKNTMIVIKQNLFWAFFYNIIAIPIAAFGFLNPMIAAAAMAFSDLFVVLNSLRLRVRKLD